ncbi:protein DETOXIFICATION 43-like [Arachis duranensis]|uniref:Protein DETOXIFICATION n=1 Tax=Arachis duranensis TaxID=130453 RepID=A0A9C6T3T8_ARADU|nr:protein DETOXIFICATION 43-like [Arachis duranensis]
MEEENNNNNNGISNNSSINKKLKLPIFVFFKDARLVLKMDELAKEILGIALPSALAVAADPIASLIDSAFIGHLGPVELAAAGVAIALLNQASRITIFPLVSITTSFVAEEDTIENLNIKALEKEFIEDVEKAADENVEKHAIVNFDGNNNNNGQEDGKLNKFTSANRSEAEKVGKKKRNIASASTALLFGTILGLLQASILIFAAKPLLAIMGLKLDSPMRDPAEKYLKLRCIGAPAYLLSLAIQGIFRGFKDTTTPLYVILAGYSLNVALDPVFIFVLKFGIRGAAFSHVISQYIMATTLLFLLTKKVYLLPPRLKDLQIFRFLTNGGLLLMRVVAVTFCTTFAASLASRLGPIPMAAFQTCLQVWLTSSLLADGLAVAVQAILACSFTEKDYKKAASSATRTLQMSFVLGLFLTFLVAFGLYFGAGLFSKNHQVVQLIRLGTSFVAATQSINTLAFVFDGVNYGASDFAYSAYSLVLVSIVSISTEFVLYKFKQFIGIWIALAIYITLRMFAGVWRMGTGTGPWRFLRGDSYSIL